MRIFTEASSLDIVSRSIFPTTIVSSVAFGMVKFFNIRCSFLFNFLKSEFSPCSAESITGISEQLSHSYSFSSNSSITTPTQLQWNHISDALQATIGSPSYSLAGCLHEHKLFFSSLIVYVNISSLEIPAAR